MKSTEQCYACCLEITLKNVQDCDTKEMYHSPDSQHKFFSGIKVRCQITFIRILIKLPLTVSNMKLNMKVTNKPVEY